MIRLIPFAACALIVNVVAPSAFSDEKIRWTGWLGPERSGWVDHFEPPAEWPRSLERVWRVDVGEGYGSPLVVGGHVFQHARQNENEVLWCRRVSDGGVVWKREWRVPFKMGGGGEWHGKGPKSCPVYADGRVFTMGISGVLSAWDAEDGRPLWTADYSAKFRPTTPYWGASTSPIVDGNRVIVHFGNDDRGLLVALDVAGGKELWTQGNAGASYSSPLIAEVDGVRQLIEWNHLALTGTEIETGRLLWEQPFPHEGTNQNMPTPTHYRGTIIVGGENRGLHCFEPKHDGGKWTVTRRWSNRKVALDMSTAIVNGEMLFGFSHYDKGRLFCVDPTTGEIRWEGPPRTGQNVTFLAVPGHVLALLDNGELRVIAATAGEYRTVTSWQVADAPTWAPPVLLSDGLLIKDRQGLTRWSFSGGSDR